MINQETAQKCHKLITSGISIRQAALKTKLPYSTAYAIAKRGVRNTNTTTSSVDTDYNNFINKVTTRKSALEKELNALNQLLKVAAEFKSIGY